MRRGASACALGSKLQSVWKLWGLLQGTQCGSTRPVPLSNPCCRLLCIWDLEAKAPASEGGEGGPAAKRARSAVPPQMMFQHAGHRVRHIV